LQSDITNVRRLESPVKRDPQAEILSKHNDLIKRGILPGEGHVLERRQFVDKPNGTGILEGDPPTISPAVVLDEDGNDICINSCLQLVLTAQLTSRPFKSAAKATLSWSLWTRAHLTFGCRPPIANPRPVWFTRPSVQKIPRHSKQPKPRGPSNMGVVRPAVSWWPTV
jgi:hypothetical protein